MGLRILDHRLEKVYATVCRDNLPAVVEAACYGCSVDHPSQKHHDVCMMMDYEEQLHFCWSALLASLDHSAVASTWVKELKEKSLSILMCHLDEQFCKRMDSKYRLEHWLPQHEDRIKRLILTDASSPVEPVPPTTLSFASEDGRGAVTVSDRT